MRIPSESERFDYKDASQLLVSVLESSQSELSVRMRSELETRLQGCFSASCFST